MQGNEAGRKERRKAEQQLEWRETRQIGNKEEGQESSQK